MKFSPAEFFSSSSVCKYCKYCSCLGVLSSLIIICEFWAPIPCFLAFNTFRAVSESGKITFNNLGLVLSLPRRIVLTIFTSSSGTIVSQYFNYFYSILFNALFHSSFMFRQSFYYYISRTLHSFRCFNDCFLKYF